MVNNKNSQIKPEVFENPLLSIHLKALRFLGFITATNQRYQLWHFLRCVFITISFVAFMVINLIRVFRDVHIIEADFILRPTSIMQISFSIHVVNAFFQRERIARLSNFVHEELSRICSCGDDVENQLKEKYVKYVRRITYAISIPALFDGYGACVECLIQTVLQSNVIYDQVLSPEKLNGTVQPILLLQSYPFGEVFNNFALGYIGPFYTMILDCTFIPLFQTFSVCLFVFVIFQIEILGKRMRDMDISKVYPQLRSNLNYNLLNDSEKNKLCLKMSEYCAMEQIKIRWFTLEMERFLRVPVFADFFIFSILICVLLFTLTFGNLSNLQYGYATVFIAMMSIFQFLYHYHATLVTKSHETLSFAIYSCDWYNYPAQMRKHILLNMMDSSQEFRVMAFILQLKLETLLNIFKGAFSYFNLLRKLGIHN